MGRRHAHQPRYVKYSAVSLLMATSVRKSVVAWLAPAMASGAAAQPTPIEAAVVVPVAWPAPAAGVGAIAWPMPSASAGPRAGAPGAPQLAGQTTEQPRSPKHAESLCQRGARVSAQARQRPPTRDRMSKPRRGSQAPRQKARAVAIHRQDFTAESFCLPRTWIELGLVDHSLHLHGTFNIFTDLLCGHARSW